MVKISESSFQGNVRNNQSPHENLKFDYVLFDNHNNVVMECFIQTFKEYKINKDRVFLFKKNDYVK